MITGDWTLDTFVINTKTDLLWNEYNPLFEFTMGKVNQRNEVNLSNKYIKASFPKMISKNNYRSRK